MRNKGAAVATTTNWMTNFVVVEITPIALYPETSNRTLEDLDAFYRTNPSPIVVGDPDVISVKRPLKYIQHEDEELEKHGKGKSMQVEDVTAA
ncbi:hypothetical protein BDV12DRAFT_204569 [Aspergillus spectabilis]